MYPRAELIELQAGKAVLQRRIALRRWQLALDVYEVTRPLRLADQLCLQWRRISPFAKLAMLPLGLWLKRRLFHRRRISGLVLRWLPALLGAFLKTSRR